MLRAAAPTMAALRPVLRQTEAAMLEKHRAGGGTVHDPSPDELTARQEFAPR